MRFFPHLLMLVCLPASIQAQTLYVTESKKALLFKGTATWCSPCGVYAPVTNEIYANHADSILFVNGHTSGSELEDPYSTYMHELINGGGGIPSYSVAGTVVASYPPTVDTLLSVANDFFATPVVANVAFNYSIVGNALTVNTTTKFFQDALAPNDTFYVGVLVVENDLEAEQNLGSGYVLETQDRVLRTVLGHPVPYLTLNEGLWADQVAVGPVSAGTSINRSFTGTLNPAWIQSNLNVIVVVWKRSSGVFTALSAEDVATGVAGLPDEDQSDFRLTPNPARETVTLQVTENSGPVLVNLRDMTGKLVYSAKLPAGNSTIDVAGFEPGLYVVSINNQVQKLVIY